ncbi:hypothetical protein ATE49_15550 [Elizabethkingia miricola]|uniref:hypothetical protein n=1 Tax=Elizabethkingia TaxID=308865 RepID=UPI0007EE2DE6|nr:hypothetical protein [Elizabethkingia miricola]MDV3751181.1 hypothetical protein [Elizabethkingia anophelis]OBS12775.1 hypothetical protein ATE49_15550 [Elizabethkingia miricola]
MNTQNSTKDQKVWAVYQLPTRQARIFANVKPVKVSELMTNEDAHEYCQHLNQFGYMDDMIAGYDVKMAK